MSPALYLVDASGFPHPVGQLRQAWSDQQTGRRDRNLPVVELEFLYSAQLLADPLEEQRLLRDVFGWVPMSEHAWERAAEVQQLLTASPKSGLYLPASPNRGGCPPDVRQARAAATVLVRSA